MEAWLAVGAPIIDALEVLLIRFQENVADERSVEAVYKKLPPIQIVGGASILHV